MSEQTRLLLDYQEMAIISLREEVARLTKERDFFFSDDFFNQVNDKL